MKFLNLIIVIFCVYVIDDFLGVCMLLGSKFIVLLLKLKMVIRLKSCFILEIDIKYLLFFFNKLLCKELVLLFLVYEVLVRESLCFVFFKIIELLEF